MKTLIVSIPQWSSPLNSKRIDELRIKLNWLDFISLREDKKLLFLIRNIDKNINEIHLIFSEHINKVYWTNTKPNVLEMYYWDVEQIK